MVELYYVCSSAMEPISSERVVPQSEQVMASTLQAGQMMQPYTTIIRCSINIFLNSISECGAVQVCLDSTVNAIDVCRGMMNRSILELDVNLQVQQDVLKVTYSPSAIGVNKYTSCLRHTTTIYRCISVLEVTNSPRSIGVNKYTEQCLSDTTTIYICISFTNTNFMKFPLT